MLKRVSFSNVHIIALLAAVMSLPMLFQYIPENDCALRYAPMAEAFAGGNFSMAFHSRFLPLYPILTGSICFILKCSGYFACKFVCWILFSLSVYPVYCMTRIIDERKELAVIASYMLIFCYPLMALIGGGTRANLKSFLVLCSVWAFIGCWKSGKLKYLLWCAVAAAGLTLTRGDSALFAIIILGVILARELFRDGKKLVYQPVLSGLLYLAIISPWLYFQYNNIGYPVPDSRHAMILNKISKRLPAVELLHNNDFGKKIASQRFVNRSIRTEISSLLSMESHPDKNSIGSFIQNSLKGLYPFYAIAAIIGIVLRIRIKRWTELDTVLASLFLLHNAAIIAQIFIADHTLSVSSRYIITVVPLYFIWSAFAFNYTFNRLKDLGRGRAGTVLLLTVAVVALISYQQGIKQLFRENISRLAETTDLKKIAGIINRCTSSRTSGKHTPLECNFYSSPILMTDQKTLGYYAECKIIPLDNTPEYIRKASVLMKNGIIGYVVMRHKDAANWLILQDKSVMRELYRGEKYSLWSACR